MANFIPGLDLNRMFFQQVVKPLLDEHFPGLKYAAGILGEGSDTLRFDNPQSMDHNWGPHMRIFLSEEDFKKKKNDIDEMFKHKLPYTFMGFPTNYTKPNEDKYLVTQMKEVKRGPVNHLIQFYTIKSFFEHYLAFDPYKNITVKDWLVFPQQALIEITCGELFHDELGLQKLRDKFAYYPDDIWLYLYLIQWDKIANEEAFMGRSGEVGDELGSNIIATHIVTHIMKLCFLIEKKYTPYIKWFGSGFSRLECAHELTHILIEIVHGKNWEERENSLGKAYEIIAKMHNKLKITRPIKTTSSDFNGRPYKVINAHDVYWMIHEKLKPRFQNLKYKIGSVDQFVDHPRINHMNYIYTDLRYLIK